VSDRPTATLLVWLAAALLGGFALLRIAGDGPGEAESEPVRIASRSQAGAERPGAGRPSAIVHVAGAVRRPGLVRVPERARVALAVRRAGGPSARADLDALNLAARVEDGQQVVVPGTGPAAGGELVAGAKLSLGSATAEQLDGVDGIGPTLAERIVEQRAQKGGFGSLDDLRDVEGIGEKRLATLREALQP
jgi:competence protein ComEA